MAQFSHPYITTGKTISLTRRTFVGKVMSAKYNPNNKLKSNKLNSSKAGEREFLIKRSNIV